MNAFLMCNCIYRIKRTGHDPVHKQRPQRNCMSTYVFCSYGLDFVRPYVSDAAIEPSEGELSLPPSKLIFTSPETRLWQHSDLAVVWCERISMRMFTLLPMHAPMR